MVITNNGKPTALLLATGILSEKEIEAEIQAARAEIKASEEAS